MELKARADIEAPVEHVFAEITDFAALERLIMRRGGDITLLEGPVPPDIGARWELRFRLRGKNRRVVSRLDRVDPGQGLRVGFNSPNVKGQCRVELVALSPGRTRLSMAVEAWPVSIAAKLLAQSLRLGRPRIERRLQATLVTYADDVAARYRARA